jgi:hypothetical protein
MFMPNPKDMKIAALERQLQAMQVRLEACEKSTSQR